MNPATLTALLRGLVDADVTRATRHALHSGMCGGVVPDPGIDAPSAATSSNTIQASARARVSVRLDSHAASLGHAYLLGALSGGDGK